MPGTKIIQLFRNGEHSGITDNCLTFRRIERGSIIKRYTLDDLNSDKSLKINTDAKPQAFRVFLSNAPA